MRLLRELRRRRVFRVAGIYVVAAWVAIQVVSEALPALELPATAIRYVWIAAIAGFPLAIVFGWFFDLTPEGIRRTPDSDTAESADLQLRAADIVILVALGIVAVAIAHQLSQPLIDAESPSAAAEIAPNSIAVLPLENLSGEAEQAYFVAGMHDALITALSKISALKVTSRMSTRAFENSEAPAAVIGNTLGVAKLIEGSVWRVGDRVQITVQLIDAANDDHIWSETYARDITDVMLLQKEITRAIADRVEVALTSAENLSLAGYQKVEPRSYEEYLKGLFNVDKFTPEGMQQAARHFERAIELDPNNVFALWGLNRLCRFQLQAGHIPPKEGGPRCAEPLLRALELSDDVAEVHLGLALGYWVYDYDWPATYRAFDRALTLNPNYAEAHIFFSHFLANQKDFERSTKHAEIAMALDPLNPFFRGLYGTQLTMIGELEAGAEVIEETIESTPGLGFGFDVLWWAYGSLGRYDRAYRAARDHFAIAVGNPAAADAIDRGFEEGGFEQAMISGAESLVEQSKQTYVPSFEIAALYDWGGNVDEAIRWLEYGMEEHSPTIPYMGVTTFIINSRDDPRFVELLRRVDLEQWATD